MTKPFQRLFISLILLLFSANVLAATFAELLRDKNDPVVGDPKSNISMVEFFDYRCAHCMEMAPVVDAVIQKNPNVRFIFKEFPVFGAQSTLGARAALAANMQGKYYPFHKALFSTRKTINMELIKSIAQKLDLDINKLSKDMYSKEVGDEIKATRALAITAGIKGTPAFFIGKTNAEDLKQLEYILGTATEKQLNNAISNARN